MSSELIINSSRDKSRIGLLKDKKLVEFHQESDETPSGALQAFHPAAERWKTDRARKTKYALAMYVQKNLPNAPLPKVL